MQSLQTQFVMKNSSKACDILTGLIGIISRLKVLSEVELHSMSAVAAALCM